LRTAATFTTTRAIHSWLVWLAVVVAQTNDDTWGRKRAHLISLVTFEVCAAGFP